MPYTHLTDDERDALQVFKSLDLEMSIMGRILGRHPSSLYREISRNSDHGFYISGKAHARAARRRKQNRPSPVRQNKPLMKCVEKLLRMEYSPDEIVGRIAIEQQHPDWHISHETIYRHIYLEARRGKDLRPHLRQGRKHQRKRLLKKDRRGIIPDRVFIDSRPAIVERKVRRGDWEGDTVEGAGKQGYVATWVDRSKKYLVAYKLPHKAAQSLVDSAEKGFRNIPKKYRKTYTVDNGKEFGACKKFCVNGYTTLRSAYGHFQGNSGRIAQGLQRAG